MNQKFIYTFFAVIFIVQAFAQETRNPNTYEPGKRAQSVYFEVFGPGVTYSFNYDTRFQNTLNGLGGRVGASYFAVDGSSIFTLPVSLNYLLGKNGSYFEMGAGATFVSFNARAGEDSDGFLFIEDGTSNTVVGSMTFGYRKQPVDGGFTFRAGVSPVFGSGNFIPWWPYIGFGYSF